MHAPIAQTISRRYSCRRYEERPIEAATRRQLQRALDELHTGPLGTKTRFVLVAAGEADRQSLRGLGTYGFIRGATGFIVGAVNEAEKALEDFGYQMEKAILAATDLGLGTCWLGGSFTQSSFAKKIGMRTGEFVPAVTATGYAAPAQTGREATFRRRLQADCRYPWEQLFFDGSPGRSMTPEAAGAYAQALEMLRIGPSASNKQPWRILRAGNAWHFYLQRTPGYGKGTLLFGILHLADLQRVDIGIAMSHFELTAQALGLSGRWEVGDPGLAPALEYIVTWRENA
ncbi:MAG: nitroreductase family protein [Chloroflexota bacterium]